MIRKNIFDYARDKYGTAPDYPWDIYPKYAVLRHSDSDKWYGLIMDVDCEKLGMEGTDRIDVMDVKCEPQLVGSLRKKKGILPAYHMNKEHWVTVVLDGSVSEKEVFQLLDDSYRLTK